AFCRLLSRSSHTPAHHIHPSYPHYCISVYLSLVTRPPPRPTLFPYTTLFRSGLYGSAEQADGSYDFLPFFEYVTDWISSADLAIDRKSTRLNSSHVSISYAVFCLKKKNNAYERLTDSSDDHTSTRVAQRGEIY